MRGKREERRRGRAGGRLRDLGGGGLNLCQAHVADPQAGRGRPGHHLCAARQGRVPHEGFLLRPGGLGAIAEIGESAEKVLAEEAGKAFPSATVLRVAPGDEARVAGEAGGPP